jgi:hypothetical protein
MSNYDQDEAARARYYALLGRAPPPRPQHPRMEQWKHNPGNAEATATRIAQADAGEFAAPVQNTPPIPVDVPQAPGPSYWDDCAPIVKRYNS